MAWRSKKHIVVSMSTLEAEYRSLANVVFEGIPLMASHLFGVTTLE